MGVSCSNENAKLDELDTEEMVPASSQDRFMAEKLSEIIENAAEVDETVDLINEHHKRLDIQLQLLDRKIGLLHSRIKDQKKKHKERIAKLKQKASMPSKSRLNSINESVATNDNETSRDISKLLSHLHQQKKYCSEPYIKQKYSPRYSSPQTETPNKLYDSVGRNFNEDKFHYIEEKKEAELDSDRSLQRILSFIEQTHTHKNLHRSQYSRNRACSLSEIETRNRFHFSDRYGVTNQCHSQPNLYRKKSDEKWNNRSIDSATAEMRKELSRLQICAQNRFECPFPEQNQGVNLYRKNSDEKWDSYKMDHAIEEMTTELLRLHFQTKPRSRASSEVFHSHQKPHNLYCKSSHGKCNARFQIAAEKNEEPLLLISGSQKHC